MGVKANRTRERAAAFMLALTVLFGLTAARASAHQPWFNNAGSPDPAKPFRLPSALEISQVVYGALTSATGIDYYAFTAPAGFDLHIGLVVADAPACASFRPVMLLIGPGLPAATSSPIAGPGGQATPQAGGGSLLFAGGEWNATADGPYAFIKGPDYTERLAGGDYLIAIYDPTGGVGTYGVALSGKENVTLSPDFQQNIAAWNRCGALPPPASPSAG